jgi:hypothetical protein
VVNLRRGFILLDLAVGVAFAVVAVAGFIAVLHGLALHARFAYEERVARETAAAELERLEAEGLRGLAEGRTELAVAPPGWENLEDPVCAVEIAPAPGGLRSVVVEASWTALKGGRKSVRLRARLGGTP